MALKIVEITDLRTFTRDFVTNRGLPNMDPHYNDLSEGVNLGNSDGTSGGNEYTYGGYLHNSDQYLWWQPSQKNASVGGARMLWGAFYAHDALCRNTNKGWWIPHTFSPNFMSITGQSFHFGGTSKQRLVIGQPNLGTGAQAFYYYGQVSGSPNSAPETYTQGWHSFTGATGAREQFFLDYWPQITADFSGVNGGAADGNTAGYWRGATGSNPNQDEYHAIAFEGITDTTNGMPGETDSNAGMMRDLGAHSLGLLLVRAGDVNFNGDGPSNDLSNKWIWVDIDTGLAVGVLGQSVPVNSYSNNQFQDDSLGDKQFQWQRVQFVPDEGSSFSEPKGELHFLLSEDGRFERDDVSIEVGDETPFTSKSTQTFVKIVDFNPFNDTSGAVRVHNRQRFVGTFEVPNEPIIASGVSLPKSGTTNNRRSPGCYYHPPSRSWINVQSSFDDPSNDGADDPIAGYSRIIRWARQLEIGMVSHPFPQEAVRGEDRVEARCKVLDEFGSPIAGATIHFRTNRQSTRDEQFDGATQTTSNYVVAEAVIDDDASLQVYETAGIDDGGTLLVEGVDYTVSSYATGTLAPVGSWPADTVSVRYRHRSSPAYPGHGTLLNVSAVSNADGVVPAFIELGENLEGELVGLETSTEEF